MHHLLAHGATARARATVVSAPTSESIHSTCHTGSSGEAFRTETRTLVDKVVHMGRYNCSLPELSLDGKEIPGKYGELCEPWDEAAWAPAMRPLASLVRANKPSGIAGNNFMCVCGQFEKRSQQFGIVCAVFILQIVVALRGGIHPRLVRRHCCRLMARASAAVLYCKIMGVAELSCVVWSDHVLLLKFGYWRI